MGISKKLAAGGARPSAVRAVGLIAVCVAALAAGAGGGLLLANENPPCSGALVAAQVVPANPTEAPCGATPHCVKKIVEGYDYNTCAGASANSNCMDGKPVTNYTDNYVGCIPGTDGAGPTCSPFETSRTSTSEPSKTDGGACTPQSIFP